MITQEFLESIFQPFLLNSSDTQYHEHVISQLKRYEFCIHDVSTVISFFTELENKNKDIQSMSISSRIMYHDTYHDFIEKTEERYTNLSDILSKSLINKTQFIFFAMIFMSVSMKKSQIYWQSPSGSPISCDSSDFKSFDKIINRTAHSYSMTNAILSIHITKVTVQAIYNGLTTKIEFHLKSDESKNYLASLDFVRPSNNPSYKELK